MSTGRRVYVEQMMACCIYPFTRVTKPGKIGTPGVVIRRSQYSVKETINRLENFLVQHGATIYTRVNQEAGGISSNQHSIALEIIMFGNPSAEAPLMAGNPLIALDLPLKVIAWQDSQHKVWLAYNDGAYLEKRYSIAPIADSPLYLDSIINLAVF